MPITTIELPDGASAQASDTGSGRPVLVLGADTTDWGAGYRLVTPSPREGGPTVPFSWATEAADLVAVLDGMGLQTVDVVAGGEGCAAALRLVHDAPLRVGKVVCHDPVGRADDVPIGAFHDAHDECMRLARAEGIAAAVAAGPVTRGLGELSLERFVVLVGRDRDGRYPADTAWFSVPDAWVADFPLPLLVIPGAHAEVAKRLAAEAPDGALGTTADIAGFLS